ncbi:MAG: bifunctional adenosylcobinamide kinase/adenosylcobinamide-phosphate guanylyltransferase [Acidimicrobiia bacterium]|nr:bifunctional adenosylcobinamide kinase/adenosylcobinamide-phosphate guanylyltransferase [Acidimicrobiia bacterium]
MARVALVLGGARSGKSVEAERLVTRWADGSAVTYVATALLDSGDDRLTERVAAHQQRRPATWATVQAGADLPAVLRATAGPVLLDSLGPWVAASFPGPPDHAALVIALNERDGDTVVVSDEVGMAVHPVSESGRWFVDSLGTVNQAVAAVAAEVRLVVAGRVLVLPPADDTGTGSEGAPPPPTPSREQDGPV